MDYVDGPPQNDAPADQFGPRLRRAAILLGAAVAAHVWMVPEFHGGRAGHSPAVIMSVDAAPAPPTAFTQIRPAGLSFAADSVLVRTELVTASGPAPAVRDPRPVRMESAPSSSMRPVATTGSPGYRTVSLKTTPDDTSLPPAEVVPSAKRGVDEAIRVAPAAAPVERQPTVTATPVLTEARLAAAPSVLSPAPSAAAPPAAADRPVAPRREEDIVRQVLRDYAQAFERLDVQAAKALWPTVDDRALQRAFQQLDSQQLKFASCGVAVTGRDANARCRGEATYRPKVGSRVLRLTAREWTFNLSRDNDRWQIVNATLQ